MVVSQLFKKEISITVLFDFLEQINCQKMENFYIVDIVSYKRSIYIDALKPFLNNLKQFYHSSKHTYINSENMNQNKFNTVVRQICRYTNTPFTKKITHDQSKYSVIYNIYFSNHNNNK